jgi:hypothetical protein
MESVKSCACSKFNHRPKTTKIILTMTKIYFIKEHVVKPATDSQGRILQWVPLGGDYGYAEFDAEDPADAPKIEELKALCGRFGIYQATEAEVEAKKKLPVWTPPASPFAPLRVLQTAEDNSNPPPSNGEAAAAVSAASLQAQHKAAKSELSRGTTGIPQVKAPSMPRETPQPIPQMNPPGPAPEPNPVLPTGFKPKVGRPGKKTPPESSAAQVAA